MWPRATAAMGMATLSGLTGKFLLRRARASLAQGLHKLVVVKKI